jgi:hypothetical protein
MAERNYWKLDASKNADKATLAIDSDPATRWSTGGEPEPGAWIRIELPEVEKLAGLILEHEMSPRDFPGRLGVEVSTDGATWTLAVEASCARARNEIHFPEVVKGRFVRITRTAIAESNCWSIHELQLLHMSP